MRFTAAPALAALLVPGFLFAADARSPRGMGGGKPPAGGDDLLFVVAGDNRPTGKGAPLPRVVRSVFEEIGLIRPDLVLWTGDTVYGYGDTPEELSREYDAFESLAKKTGVPLFNSPGNHEIHRSGGDDACAQPRPALPPDSEAQYAKRFGSLYGSFDAGPAHFVSLDTAEYCREDAIDGEQLDWLRADLEAHKDARAIFVFSHTEFFSSPQIDEPAGRDHPPLRNRDELHALFRKYPVKAVFSGHEHVYWRESHDGIEYFVAGGAGAPLYAAPERGGFGHYILVALSPEGIRYDVVGPGRLYVERAARRKIWIVNSNDAAIPLRGLTVDASGLGPCASLPVRSDLRKWDGTPVPVPVSKLACTKNGAGSRLTLGLTAPKGTSVPILLGRN